MRAEQRLGAAKSLDLIRSTFKNKGYRLRPNGRFAVLNVGQLRALPYGLTVEHYPNDDDRCHSGICGTYGLSEDREKEVAFDMVYLLSEQDVYPSY